MQLVNMNDSYFLKQNDTATDIHLQVQDYLGAPIDLVGKRVEVIVGNVLGRLLTKPAKLLPGVGELKFGLDIGEVLPSGKQWVEVHIYEATGEKIVAPSKGFYQLSVERSIDELQVEITTVTLDYFVDRFNQMELEIDQKVGPQGPQGIQGIQGPIGLTGPQGEQGIQGETGPQGIQGPRGAQGDQGPKGEQGLKGDRGPEGPQGLKGDKGDTGEKGEQGTGVSIIAELANVSDLPVIGNNGDAYLIQGDLYVWNSTSWTNVGNIKGPKGDKGEKGDQGVRGLQGEKGDAFIYDDFTPVQLEGLKGPKGDQGVQGPKGEQGEQGEQGIQGQQGVQGEQGPKGDPGKDADMTIVNSHTTQLANHESRLVSLESGSSTVATNVTGLYRGQAWLMLKQQAADRIEDGVAFADDMGANRFGFELDTVASQNIIVRNGKMLMLEDVEVAHSAIDKVVVASAYNTEGNGGRKLVKLSNGWLVVGVKILDNFYFYVDKGDEKGFQQLCWINHVAIKNHDISLVSKGTIVYATHGIGVAVQIHSFDAVTVPNQNIYNVAPYWKAVIEVSQTEIGNVSLAIDPTNGRLHAAWASKNAILPNGFNIRYSKSIDEGKTWSTVEQISNRSNTGEGMSSPSILVRNDGNPVITTVMKTVSQHILYAYVISTSTWTPRTINSVGTYPQASPSAVVDKENAIHVAWHGVDATNQTIDYIRYSKSPDGGVTWAPMQKLQVGINTSISINSLGHIFITYQDAGVTKFIKSIDKGDSWSEPTVIGTGTNPSTLADNTVNFTTPLTVRMGTSNVLFNGEWTAQVEEPRLIAKAVYNIPSTDFVGAFVKKIGSVTVNAFLNDLPMDSELLNNEYKFQEQLALPAPAKLRLELSRPDVTGGEADAITRILGGRS